MDKFISVSFYVEIQVPVTGYEPVDLRQARDRAIDILRGKEIRIGEDFDYEIVICKDPEGNKLA